MNIEYPRLAQLRDLICEVVPQKGDPPVPHQLLVGEHLKKKVEELQAKNGLMQINL